MLAALALAGAAALVSFVPAAAGSSKQPTLETISASGYQLAVQGTGWAPEARVTFTLALGNNEDLGLELTTTKSGHFEVAVKQVDFSHRFRFWARDFSGHTVMGPIGDPCPSCGSSTSGLVVLEGKQWTPRVTRVEGIGNGKAVLIKVGAALWLWEKAKASSTGPSPAYIPTAPDAYFSLVSYGYLAVLCPITAHNCSSGFFWEWIGMKPGQTGIALRPWCGTNPCPQDYIVELPVRIEPR